MTESLADRGIIERPPSVAAGEEARIRERPGTGGGRVPPYQRSSNGVSGIRARARRWASLPSHQSKHRRTTDRSRRRGTLFVLRVEISITS